MRVIQQIVEYLEQQGTLTQDDLHYLRSEGFVPYPADAEKYEAPDDIDETLYDEGPSTPERRRRGHRRFVVRGRNLTTGQLRAGISARLSDWAEPLEGLIALARKLDATANITSAPLILLQAETTNLDRSVHDAVDTRQPSLKTLWKSLDFTEIRDPAPTPGEQVDGPVVRAYRWLLRATNRHESPGCGWLLRYWQVRWAVQLVGAQKRILESLGRLYDADWNLIHRELCREQHNGAFWTFTLLYNARRFAEGLPIGTAVAHRDEKRLASLPANNDDWLRAWSYALLMDRQRARQFLGVHGSEIGLQAVTVDESGTVLHWNTQSGRVIRRWEGHTACVSAVQFTKDGNRAITGSKDGTTRLWDVATGKQLRCFDNRPTTGDADWYIAVSPDETLLVTGSGESRELAVWEVATGKHLRVIHAGMGELRSIACSPCGTYIASATAFMVSLRDLRTGYDGRCLVLPGCSSVTFSPDGKYLIAGDEKGKIWLWRKVRNVGAPWHHWDQECQLLAQEKHYKECSVRWVTVTPDNQYVLSASDYAGVRLYNLPHSYEHVRMEGNTNNVNCISISEDGNLALTTGRGTIAQLWDLSTGKLLRRFTEHTHTICGGALRPNSVGVALVAPSRWEKVFE